MKRYSLIICLVFIFSLSGVASAQVVMLEDAGGIVNKNVHYPGSATSSYTTSYSLGATVPIVPIVGHTTWDTNTTTTIDNLQAAFEFNLTPVNTTTFTSLDFTAKLDGLNVANSYTRPGPNHVTMNVDLFDMGDANEDGDVYYDDYNMTRGSRIARRTHTFPDPPVPAVPADFNDLDVTDAVRNDLFGAGAGDFSGFILISPNAQSELVWYDPATPTITITTGVSPPVLSDLAISKTVDDTTPDESQTITYTITLTNNGPNEATTVSITDLLPAGVTYVSDTPSLGVYVSGTGVWTVVTINSGANATLNIQATVDAGTGGSTITNLVTAVSLDQTDSNATPDDLSEAITVNNVGGGGGGGGGGCFIVNAAR